MDLGDRWRLGGGVGRQRDGEVGNQLCGAMIRVVTS